MTAGDEQAAQDRGHPLDPLAGDELRRAARIALAREGRPSGPQSAWTSRSTSPTRRRCAPGGRRARSTVRRGSFCSTAATGRRSSCDLARRGSIVSERVLEGVQPAMTFDEYDECEQMVRADLAIPGGAEAARDNRLRAGDGRGLGPRDPRTTSEFRDRRLAWTPCWVRDDPDDNPYAHPIDGLFAIVDLNAMEVLRHRGPRRRPDPAHVRALPAGERPG